MFSKVPPLEMMPPFSQRWAWRPPGTVALSNNRSYAGEARATLGDGAGDLEGATLGDAATMEEWAFVAAWAFVACWD